jgi:hypothetical protein
MKETLDRYGKRFVEEWTDPNNTWTALTLLPGVGLPLSLMEKGKTWYSTGETPGKEEGLGLLKLIVAREAIYSLVYYSPMNLNRIGYFAWKRTGGMALGQVARFVFINPLGGAMAVTAVATYGAIQYEKHVNEPVRKLPGHSGAGWRGPFASGFGTVV